MLSKLPDRSKVPPMESPSDRPLRVTQDEVARLAGVTRSVVSYVLNNNSRAVAPETRRRVLEAIEELGYRPNKFAQGLMRTGQGALAGKQLGIVMNSINMLLRPYYTEILAGIHSAAHEQSYHIRFTRFLDELKDPILFNELIHEEEICGLILVSLDQGMSSDADRELVGRIRQRIDNIVCVEWQLEGCSAVVFDRQAAACTATGHLMDQGYEPLVYIGESDNRVLGFKQAFLQRGQDNVGSLVVEEAMDLQSGFEAAARVFGNPGSLHRPRGVCAGSDEVAIGVMHWLSMNGLRVPQEVAIASIDNIEMSAYTNPPLSTVNVQKSAMGRRAVELLIANAGQTDREALILSLPTDLVIRQSS